MEGTPNGKSDATGTTVVVVTGGVVVTGVGVACTGAGVVVVGVTIVVGGAEVVEDGGAMVVGATEVVEVGVVEVEVDVVAPLGVGALVVVEASGVNTRVVPPPSLP